MIDWGRVNDVYSSIIDPNVYNKKHRIDEGMETANWSDHLCIMSPSRITANLHESGNYNKTPEQKAIYRKQRKEANRIKKEFGRAFYRE